MNRTISLRFALFALLLPALPGCGELASAAGRIAWLLLLPLVFIGLFVWALRCQSRRPPERIEEVDERRYPDYRGDRDRR